MSREPEPRSRRGDYATLNVDDDLDHFLARPDIDLVEILLPHHLHLPVALKAMAAGKIVSLQKPMCLDLDEADRLVAAAEPMTGPSRCSRISCSTRR